MTKNLFQNNIGHRHGGTVDKLGRTVKIEEIQRVAQPDTLNHDQINFSQRQLAA